VQGAEILQTKLYADCSGFTGNKSLEAVVSVLPKNKIEIQALEIAGVIPAPAS